MINILVTSRHGLKWEYLPKQSTVLLDKIYKFEHITTYELGGEAADRVLRDKGTFYRTCTSFFFAIFVRKSKDLSSFVVGFLCLHIFDVFCVCYFFLNREHRCRRGAHDVLRAKIQSDGTEGMHNFSRIFNYILFTDSFLKHLLCPHLDRPRMHFGTQCIMTRTGAH